MSQIDDIKKNAEEIYRGLKRVSPNREAAMPVHINREILADLEEKAGQLVEQLEALDK